MWKLKREKRIAAQPLIPFHEFRWGAWLRDMKFKLARKLGLLS